MKIWNVIEKESYVWFLKTNKRKGIYMAAYIIYNKQVLLVNCQLAFFNTYMHKRRFSECVLLKHNSQI